MNLKKIITGAVVGAMAVSAMTVSAFADDAKTNLEIQLAIAENATWSEPKTEKVDISKDGEYTFKLDNLEIDPATVTVLYLKDAYAIEKGSDLEEGYKSSVAEGFSVSFALKINGKDVAIDEAFPTDKMKEGSIFDYCLYNTWVEDGSATFIKLPEETITSVEVVVTVTGTGNGAQEDDPAGTDATGTEAAGTEAAGTDATGTTAAGTTNNNGGDKNQPNTGVEGVAVVAGLAVLATSIIVVAKKRK